jgi:hypothetical protein
MALDKFNAAPLPNPPSQWDPQYMRQVIRVIETYFSQLDSLTPNSSQQYTADRFIGGSFSGTSINATSVNADTLSANQAVIGYQASNGILTSALISYGHRNGSQISESLMVNEVYANNFYGDGRFISTPYNQLTSDIDQTAAAIDQAYAVTLNGSEFPNGISITSSSRITFAKAGIYNIAYSIQFKNTTNDQQDIDIWLRYNGTDIANSNSRFTIPARKSAGDPSHLIAVTPTVVDIFADNGYIEIMWRVENTGVSIEHFPAITAVPGVTPAIPATPSVIIGVTFLSAQFPPAKRVAPLPVFGFGQIGSIEVVTR